MFDMIKANAAFMDGKYKEAFNAYTQGALVYHDPLAAFNLAFMYFKGYHSPVNYVWARKYFHRALGLETGEAHFNLALMYMRGQGGDVSMADAFSLMKQSAACGCVHAQIYLGVAYTLGCLYDPVEISCLSRIPFPRVVKQEVNYLYLPGEGNKPALEDLRYEMISADEYDAMEMFTLAATQEDDTYIEEQIGAAKYMIGQAMIEGFGAVYDPRQGYQMMKEAALTYGAKDAIRFLMTHKDTARVYGVDTSMMAYLSDGNDT